MGDLSLEDYQVTDPANPLINVGARRSVLQTNPTAAGQLCSVNSDAGIQATLPSVRYTHSTLSTQISSFNNGARGVGDEAGNIPFGNITM